jgi:hypothetical protein
MGSDEQVLARCIQEAAVERLAAQSDAIRVVAPPRTAPTQAAPCRQIKRAG